MKGIRELKGPPVKIDLAGIRVQAFEIRLDQLETNEWFSAEEVPGDEKPQSEKSEGDFFAVLRQVSRRTKPSSPGEASSET